MHVIRVNKKYININKKLFCINGIRVLCAVWMNGERADKERTLNFGDFRVDVSTHHSKKFKILINEEDGEDQEKDRKVDQARGCDVVERSEAIWSQALEKDIDTRNGKKHGTFSLSSLEHDRKN